MSICDPLLPLLPFPEPDLIVLRRPLELRIWAEASLLPREEVARFFLAPLTEERPVSIFCYFFELPEAILCYFDSWGSGGMYYLV